MLSQREPSIALRTILTGLLVVTLLELTLAGSGRLLQFGPLTMRMYLFFFCFLLSFLFYSVKGKLATSIFYLSLVYTALLALSTFIGFMNGAAPGDVFEDIKPLSFFYSILFFSMTINTIDDIRKVSSIFKTSSLIMSIGYLLFLGLALVGIINIMDYYEFLNSTGEFMFRGESGLFYKGFIYICIGLLFFLVSPVKKNKLIAIIPFIALVMTFTRGFLLATIFVYLVYLLFFFKNKAKSFVFLILFAIGAVLTVPYYLEVLGDKSESDSVRIIQLEEVRQRITPFTFITGNGFGIGIPIRPGHMEISFLEIFHKQGITGIAFWFLILALQLYYYWKASKKGHTEGLPYLLSTILIYIQSFTNPYINNPIGMSVVLVSLIIQQRLAQKKI